MNIVDSIAAFATANAGVALSQNFVENIISPITAKILGALNVQKLSEYQVGDIGIGSFIEALIQFAFVVLIVTFIVKNISN